MSDFALGVYCCGALGTFVLGLFGRQPSIFDPDTAPVPLWEIALFAAFWPVLAVFVVRELHKEAKAAASEERRWH